MDRELFSHLASWLIFIVILVGIYYRHHKFIHRRIMISAFALDILLVLYIELGRDAVKQAMDLPGGWLGVHIVFSILTIILYVVMIVLGQKLFNGDESIRQIHKLMAIIFIVVKSMNLVTSYLF